MGLKDTNGLRYPIRASYRLPEEAALAPLVKLAEPDATERPAIEAAMRALVAQLREDSSAGLVERFMQEYQLGSDEGIALLSLAEAYLRVPDHYTAATLIRDKTSIADWTAHRGGSSSTLVNAATFGLIFTKALNRPEGGALRRVLARMGEPFIRGAVGAGMQMMGGQFVLGRDIDEAIVRAAREGVLCSFDMLGEAARTAEDAARYFNAYAEAIRVAGGRGEELPLMERHSISVKLSALHPRYEEAHSRDAVPQLAERVIALSAAAAEQGIGLTIDAEEADRLEMSLDIIEAVARSPLLAGWEGLGMAIQAYQKRALPVIEWADALGRETGRRIAVRLVKGAYWDTEIKFAQEQGLSDYPVYTRKEATDVSYLACAKRMLAAPNIQPAFATHNAVTLAILLHWIGDRQDIEFQRLHGMGEGLYRQAMKARSHRVRVYAPVGGYRDLLAYLVRRLLENGANSSFVHQSGDASLSVEDIAVHPVDQMRAHGFTPHPLIPRPAAIYGPQRRNSEGMDLSDRETLASLLDAMKPVWNSEHKAAALIAGKDAGGTPAAVQDPAHLQVPVGKVIEATPADARRAIDTCAAAFDQWSRRPVEERAACLERMADLLERDRSMLMALAVREAGKTMDDALAEVREAVDFCRYYAIEGRRLFTSETLPGPTGEHNELTLGGRGVFACISPWNFPLAIFLGQVAAALVSGNTVVAKPAPQTPLIAHAAVKLFHEAGIPADVLALVPGGPAVGQALVADPRVAGVAFTGSTGAARQIARSLLDDESRPIVPLIAETGGLNAMIVDSTALPEQVVRDVITSAFRSAGQRCSALRLLCLQEEVADNVLHMLKGAMAELSIGDPGEIETDVGPLIDAEAHRRIQSYIDANRDKVIHQMPVPEGLDGHFIGPCIIRLDSPEELEREVFGPVLHVVTWRGEALGDLVDRINARGYGLTMGLHSRLDSSLEAVRGRAKVGNLYVNRSMIGAVVGVQPFGGEGLSGTGPKAGGPHYLLRFAVERAISIDTTSAGGNASLLSLESQAISQPTPSTEAR